MRQSGLIYKFEMEVNLLSFGVTLWQSDFIGSRTVDVFVLHYCNIGVFDYITIH